MEIAELRGETLTYIDVDTETDRILLTTASGRTILIHHNQDCCESVRIEDTEGNFHELIGRVITEASEHTQTGEYGEYEHSESWTKTQLTFRAGASTVISRWIGESNGYYSETVDIEDLSQIPAFRRAGMALDRFSVQPNGDGNWAIHGEETGETQYRNMCKEDADRICRELNQKSRLPPRP